jgi:hypothetical protein
MPGWVIAGFVLAFGLVGIYLAGLIMSPTHRTAYDLIAGSHVVFGTANPERHIQR